MRVLVVEDDISITEIVQSTLKEEAHAVDLISNGIEAQSRVLTEPYDLIILDLMLPGIDGLSVLRTMRQVGNHTPVLILTAKGEIPDRVAGLDAGADDYLVKPFAITELTARVRALFRRKTGDKIPLLTLGNLSLDPSTKEVKVSGNVIDLTTREYAILEFLMRNKNRMLSKGMIADHVWDYHFDSDYNLIEVYIKRLRKKIEDETGERLIHTVRNSGYILKEMKE